MPFSEEQRTLAAVDVAVAARADTHELSDTANSASTKTRNTHSQLGSSIVAMKS